MILDEIKALLIADAGVTAQLSTRVYTGSVLPRGYVLPAALLHKMPHTGDTEYTFQGTDRHREIAVQLDVYADTESAAQLSLKAIRNVLKNYKGMLSGGSDVQGTFWEMDSEMPFSADINMVAQGFRLMAVICFHYIEVTS